MGQVRQKESIQVCGRDSRILKRFLIPVVKQIFTMICMGPWNHQEFGSKTDDADGKMVFGQTLR